MKCFIVEDLIIDYINGNLSDATNQEIKEHLSECNHCKNIYEEMTRSFDYEPTSDIDFAKDMKKRILKRNLIIFSVISLVILIGLAFSKNCIMTLPYNPNTIKTTPFQAVKITEKNGTRHYGNANDLDFSQKKKLISQKTETKDLRMLSIINVHPDTDIDVIGRTIKKKGKNTRIVYCSATETLFGKLSKIISGGNIIDTFSDSMYGKNNLDYERIEIYYLPDKNLKEKKSLSNKDFVELSKQANLIYKGKI